MEKTNNSIHVKDMIKNHTLVGWAERGAMMLAAGNVMMSTLPGGVLLNAVHIIGCSLISAGATKVVCEGVDAITNDAAVWLMNKIDNVETMEEVEEE